MKFKPLGYLVLLLAVGLLVAVPAVASHRATPSPAPPLQDQLCELQALHPEIEVYAECVPTTTTTTPTTTTTTPATTTTTRQRDTTTTRPPRDTTTTTLPTTTTTLPPGTTTTLPPGSADACVLDQIIRDQTKRNGTPKIRFNIITTARVGNEPATGWKAPYTTNLDNGYGWISGDRAGYQGAYMFLVNLDTGELYARVGFRRVEEAASYGKVNDAYMDEIQTTQLSYRGECVFGEEWSQEQQPRLDQEYNAPTTGDERPVILIRVNGVVVEDRSYAGTTPFGDVENFQFNDGGHITEPFKTYNGFGTDPHLVYERQTVIANFDQGDGMLPFAVVYYDILNPAASLSTG